VVRFHVILIISKETQILTATKAILRFTQIAKFFNIFYSMAATVQKFPEDSIENKAYRSVSGIPTIGANDSVRLGYHVYLYLTKHITSLKEAIHVAQARMTISKEEAFSMISKRLSEEGISVEG